MLSSHLDDQQISVGPVIYEDALPAADLATRVELAEVRIGARDVMRVESSAWALTSWMRKRAIGPDGRVAHREWFEAHNNARSALTGLDLVWRAPRLLQLEEKLKVFINDAEAHSPQVAALCRGWVESFLTSQRLTPTNRDLYAQMKDLTAEFCLVLPVELGGGGEVCTPEIMAHAIGLQTGWIDRAIRLLVAYWDERDPAALPNAIRRWVSCLDPETQMSIIALLAFMGDGWGQTPSRGDTSRARARAKSVDQALKIYAGRVLADTSSGASTARSLQLLLAPFGSRAIADLTAEDVVRALDRVAASAPVHANRIQSYARSFFAWCVQQELMDQNPAHGLGAYATGQVVGGRQLSIEEIVMIWDAAGRLGRRNGIGVRLLIATAAKRDQIAGMGVSEFNRSPLDNGLVWSPAGETVSEGGAYRIVLPALAEELVVDALQSRRAGAEYILSRIGDAPMDGWSKAKKGLDAQLATASPNGDFGPWQLNDIRRSFPALATEYADIDQQIADGCLRRVSCFSTPQSKHWSRSSAMAERVSEALADWNAVLAKRLAAQVGLTADMS